MGMCEYEMVALRLSGLGLNEWYGCTQMALEEKHQVRFESVAFRIITLPSFVPFSFKKGHVLET